MNALQRSKIHVCTFRSIQMYVEKLCRQPITIIVLKTLVNFSIYRLYIKQSLVAPCSTKTITEDVLLKFMY